MTASDVENYKQIKSDLDELRNLVEKSELWVFKDKKGDEPKKKKKSSEGKKVRYLNNAITELGDTVKPVLSGHSTRRPKLVFKTDHRLM